MLPFSSFWQAGYEGADHINTAGQRLVMDALTDHQTQFRSDYLALQHFGIRTVRESIGWRQAEEDPERTFATLRGKLQAAQELGIQINWTFCHYGWPEDVDLFSDDFVPRFAAFCQRVAAFLAPWYPRAPIYSPMNEISFLSWGLSVGLFGNHREADPDDIKRQLVRATLAGCDAIWLADPRARFLHCDPIIHLVPDEESEACYQLAAELNASQFQAWDMLAGAREPELGGAPRYLDIVGANYYHANQWEACSNQRLAWHLGDGRRKPLHKLLLNLAQRYCWRKPAMSAAGVPPGSLISPRKLRRRSWTAAKSWASAFTPLLKVHSGRTLITGRAAASGMSPRILRVSCTSPPPQPCGNHNVRCTGSMRCYRRPASHRSPL